MTRVLFALQSIFSVWMLVDAIQRRCSTYWYLVVLCPFGEWVYFFKVKVHDPEFDWFRHWARQLTKRNPTTDQLRHRVERTPSFDNKLNLGQALFDDRMFSEALELFRAALELQPDSTEALYGAALSELELARYDDAVRDLRSLIEREPAFGEYAAWFDLVEALSRGGRSEEALEALGALVETSPRLAHRVVFACRLQEAARLPDAAAQLRTGIADYEDSPRFHQRRERGWARKARRMLRALGSV